MRNSLRSRLMVPISAAILSAWAATAVFSYVDARDRIGAMLDDHLVQAAALLLGGGDSPGSRPALHWGEEGHGLVFQVRDREGRLLFHSADAPAAPLSVQDVGFSEVERGGQRWRVFGIRAADGGMLVQVGEHADFRNTLAASIARHLLHPLAFALPILALLIWLAVRWGLSPLRRLADVLATRDPSDVSPLPSNDAPSEVQPLVGALDALFTRVSSTMENERRFTADAAHELRTPLAAIRTHAEVALASLEEAERTNSLRMVVAGTARANRLVEQLLVLARLDSQREPPSLVPVSLRELVAKEIGEAAPLASRRALNLGLLDSPDDSVMGDPDLLGILVRNLLDNAMRYTEPGDTIDVSVRVAGGRVVLLVADSGPGIRSEERSRIFERFYRGRGSGEEGSGVGLSIVSRIAALHLANPSVTEGVEGRGLGVEISFPIPLR